MPRTPTRGVWFLRANGFEYGIKKTSDAKFVEAFRGFFPHMMAPADLLRWWARVPDCGDGSLAKMRRSGIHIVEPAQARQRLAEATDGPTTTTRTRRRRRKRRRRRRKKREEKRRRKKRRRRKRRKRRKREREEEEEEEGRDEGGVQSNLLSFHHGMYSTR